MRELSDSRRKIPLALQVLLIYTLFYDFSEDKRLQTLQMGVRRAREYDSMPSLQVCLLGAGTNAGDLAATQGELHVHQV